MDNLGDVFKAICKLNCLKDFRYLNQGEFNGKKTWQIKIILKVEVEGVIFLMADCSHLIFKTNLSYMYHSTSSYKVSWKKNIHR